MTEDTRIETTINSPVFEMTATHTCIKSTTHSETNTTNMESSSGKTTPPRHNYHNTNTPIASIKRPRSSLVNKNTSTGTSTGSLYATPLRAGNAGANGANTGTSGKAATESSTSTPMSIVWTDRNKNESSIENDGDDNGGDDIVFASPLPATRSGRVLPSSSTNNQGVALSLSEAEALTLSPMHGFRPVTYRDVRDINNATGNIRPLVLHDIEEGDDDDYNPRNGNGTLQRQLSPSSSSTSSPTSAGENNGGIPSSSSWVGKKVDALFVYQFLHHEEQEQQQRLNNSSNDKSLHDYIEPEENDSNRATPMVDVEKNSNGDTMTAVITSSRSSDTQQQTASTTATLSSSSTSKYSPASSSEATFDVNDDDDVDVDIADNTDDDLDHSHHRTNAHDCDDEDDNSMGRPVHPTDMEEFNPWQFIKSLPEYERIAHNVPAITLPAKASGAPDKTLVLDLDETLVHCSVEPPEVPADLTFPVVFHGITYTVHVKLRPFLHEFLERIKDKFEIIVFTASQKVYADELLNLIDPSE
jgi:NLI interacting factor-like phosphatase